MENKLSKKEQISMRIKDYDSSFAFIAKDFMDIADYETVKKILNRMADKGDIKKVMKGVYFAPTFSELLGVYEAASPHSVAEAIARKFNWNISPSGTTALNLLSLSSQVPAKWEFISDGPYRTYTWDTVEIEFRHRNNREIANMSYATALVSEHSHQLKLMGFQRALRHMPPLGRRISCLLYRHNSVTICI